MERGWTSKRDLVGYYNPLTQSFDQNNKRVYDALKILDHEKRLGISRFPLIILLDEANLSPMEYYWADFMNLCDGISDSSEINMGEDNIFMIPQTLHFMATINNDHTTETLSPRLIDRSAVITLPKARSVGLGDDVIDPSKIRHISWDSLNNAFVKVSEEDIPEPGRLESAIAEIRNVLREQNEYLSPRREKSFRRYYAAAARLLDSSDDESGRDPYLIAIDYAIAQFVLPKVNGYGDEYRTWLEGCLNECQERSLVFTENIIASILQNGDRNLNSYQFFI